jgi:hypothetical protein
VGRVPPTCTVLDVWKFEEQRKHVFFHYIMRCLGTIGVRFLD